jgi:hypothetical protein
MRSSLYDATLDLSGVTIYACHTEEETHASGLHLDLGVQGTVERTVISHSTRGQAVYCDATSTAALTCCDIYGNAGGDWTGSIAGQYGLGGNISEDPLFCDAAGWFYELPLEYHFGLNSDSPCAPFSDPNPECDLIGAFGVACGPAAVDGPGNPVRPTLLLSHAPNPMQRAARISYSIPYVLDVPTPVVHLAIYDATGRLVRSLVDEEQTVGIHDASWDGTDSSNRHTGAGVYFCRLQVGDEAAVQRMIRVD